MNSLRLFLAFACLVVCASSNQNPGFDFRITPIGLQYSKNVGIDILTKEIYKVHIPDIHSSSKEVAVRSLRAARDVDSVIGYDITNITIVQFTIPEEFASISTDSSGIRVVENKIAISITALYQLSMWPFGHVKSGTINVDISAAGFDCLIRFNSTADGHAAVFVQSDNCQAEVSEISVTVHGNILDDIVNWFKKLISKSVKNKINDIMQSQVASLINGKVSSALAQIPVIVKLFQDFFLDYSLLGAPVVTDQFVGVNAKGIVSYNGQEQIPFDAPQTAAFQPDLSKHVFVQATDFIGNTFGYALFQSGILTMRIDSAFLNSLKNGTGKYLETSCKSTEICFGTLIPKVAKQFPNASVVIQNKATSSPTSAINATGVYFRYEGDMAYYITDEDAQTHFAFDTLVGIDLQFTNLSLATGNQTVGYQLFAEVHATESRFSMTSSGIEGLTADDVKGIWGMVVYGFADQSLNDMFQKGVKIPNVPYVQLQNATFKLFDHTLVLEANVNFVGGPL